MLFLLFHLDRDRYVLDIARVIEVLPLVALKAVPRAPVEIAGILNYRGAPVPVVDVSRSLLGRPSRPALSTRLVLTRREDGGKLLGLILEEATGTLRRDAGDFADGGVTAEKAPCLGAVASDIDGLIQWVDPERLLSAEARAALAAQEEKPSHPMPPSPA